MITKLWEEIKAIFEDLVDEYWKGNIS